MEVLGSVKGMGNNLAKGGRLPKMGDLFLPLEIKGPK